MYVGRVCHFKYILRKNFKYGTIGIIKVLAHTPPETPTAVVNKITALVLEHPTKDAPTSARAAPTSAIDVHSCAYICELHSHIK